MDKQTVNTILNGVPTYLSVFMLTRTIEVRDGEMKPRKLKNGTMIYNVGGFPNVYRSAKNDGVMLELADKHLDALAFIGYERI